MGVHGLWALLKPYARATSPEEWRGKCVAVDASIWISQFRMVAVDGRADDGDVSTRILEGCLRRLLKLLYFGIKPVFIFDGPAPALKHREQARRRISQYETERKKVEGRARRILNAQIAQGRDVVAESRVVPETTGANTTKETSGTSSESENDDVPSIPVRRTKRSRGQDAFSIQRRVRNSSSFSTHNISRFVQKSVRDKQARALQDTRAELAQENEMPFQRGTNAFLGSRSALEAAEDRRVSILEESLVHQARGSSSVVGPVAVRQHEVLFDVEQPSDQDEENEISGSDVGGSSEEDYRGSSATSSVVIISEPDEGRKSSPAFINANESDSDVQILEDAKSSSDEFEAVIFDTPKKSVPDTPLGPVSGKQARLSDPALLFATPEKQYPAIPRTSAPEVDRSATGEVSRGVPEEQDQSAAQTTGPRNTTVAFELLGLVELLDCLNIPYLTSPGEADAQCAWLSKMGLVDVVLTEDSDVLVFGAKQVIRGFFDTKNPPQLFQGEVLKAQAGLTPNVLAGLALLLGSDYTEGVHGLGKLGALDLLAAFLPQGDPDPTVGSVHQALTSWRQQAVQIGPVVLEESLSILQGLIRKHLKAPSFLPKGFPSREVLEAYSVPTVDSSREALQCGVPDFNKLRHLAYHQCQWTARDVIQRIDPVHKKWLEQQAGQATQVGDQLLLSHFFQAKEAVPKKLLVLGAEDEPEGELEARKLGGKRTIGASLRQLWMILNTPQPKDE